MVDSPLIPMVREVAMAELDPVAVFERFQEPGMPSFLLESREREQPQARYSYVGFRPKLLALGNGNPLEKLASIVATQLAEVDQLPPFGGGVVGYLGYETARWFERL